MNHASGVMCPRSLTEKERTFAQWLIENGRASEEEKSRYLSQLAQATVVRTCACGCATIDFAIAGREAPREGGLIRVGDFLASDHSYGVFVFQHGGILSGVEIYLLADEDTPAEFPDTGSLVLAEWKEEGQPVRPDNVG